MATNANPEKLAILSRIKKRLDLAELPLEDRTLLEKLYKEIELVKDDGEIPFFSLFKEIESGIEVKNRIGHTLFLRTVFRVVTGSTPFVEAVDRLKLLKALGANIEAKDPHGNTALRWAARKGHVSMIITLVSLGADLNARDIKGRTVLMAAATTSEHLEAFKLLISLGVDVNARDTDGYTVLDKARSFRSVLIVKAIREHQIKKNDKEIKVDQVTGKKIEKQSDIEDIIKKSGHTLGFTIIISQIKSTGYLNAKSYSLLQTYLHTLSSPDNPDSIGWLQEYYFPENGPIREALNFANEWLKADGSITHDDLIQYHAQGKPVFLPTGWPEHGFTLIAWNNVLIVCNRGTGGLKNAISVFKIPHEGKLTKAFLESILPETGESSEEQVLKGINNFVDTTNPVLTFPSKEQKHGTCSFVNLKSSLFPFLCFLELLNTSTEKRAVNQFDMNFLTPYLNDGPLAPVLKTVMEDTRKKYKEFTTKMRNANVDELCTTFELLAIDSPDRKIYLEIFKGILREHHGQFRRWQTMSDIMSGQGREKINAETKRAIQILNSMHAKEKEELLIALLFEVPPKFSLIKWVVEQGIDINTKDSNGNTVLTQAIFSENSDLTRMLITCGASLDNLSKNTYTNLFNALVNYNQSVVDALKKLGKVNDRNFEIYSCNMLEYFITQGASTNIRDSYGTTVLMKAIAKKDMALTRLLLTSENADVNALSGDASRAGLTALMITIMDDNMELFKLIEPYSNVDTQNRLGRTALMSAVLKNELKYVQLLTEMGADLSLKDTNGNTALMLAKDESIIAYLKEVEQKQGAKQTLPSTQDPALTEAENEPTAQTVAIHMPTKQPKKSV